MSIIGPRPGLWNQDVLTAERDKYGANDVKPGLTGWAQINGRDELEIPEKAKLDGYYVQNIFFNSVYFDFFNIYRYIVVDDRSRRNEDCSFEKLYSKIPYSNWHFFICEKF